MSATLESLLGNNPNIKVTKLYTGEVIVEPFDRQDKSNPPIHIFGGEPSESPTVKILIPQGQEEDRFLVDMDIGQYDREGIVVDVKQPVPDIDPREIVARASIGLRLLQAASELGDNFDPHLYPRIHDESDGQSLFYDPEVMLELLSQPVKLTIEHWYTSPSRGK